MAYSHFKARLGEMDGISHEEGEELMVEGRKIIINFSDYTARLSKKIRFRYYTPLKIDYLPNNQYVMLIKRIFGRNCPVFAIYFWLYPKLILL